MTSLKHKPLFLFFALFFSISLSAQNIYVSLDGLDDTTDTDQGSSMSKAFRTVTFAAKEASAGDTIFVKKGTYKNENFGDNAEDIYNDEKTVSISEVHGTEDNYIVIMPYNGKRVKFRGDGAYIFRIRNSSYIKVQDFLIVGEVNNIDLSYAEQYQFNYLDENGVEQSRLPLDEMDEVTDAAIAALVLDEITTPITRPTYFDTKGLLVQSSHHITIENNVIHHTPGTGLRFQACDYIHCVGNEVHNCSRRSAVGTHALVFHSTTSIDTNNGVHSIVEGNKVHNNYNELYSWSPHKTAIKTEIDEGKGISMQKNTSAKGWTHGWIVVQNNITYRNGLSGIHVNQGERFRIFNNVSYNNNRYGTGNNNGITLSDAIKIRVRSNISCANSDWGGFAYAMDDDCSDIIMSNNVYKGNIDSQVEDLASSMIEITNEQLFTDALQRDFSLLAGSPAINAAHVGTSPDVDFFGNTRDAQPDCGAVEFFGTSNAAQELPGIDASTILIHYFNAYPNPMGDELNITTDAATTEIYTQMGVLVETLDNPEMEYLRLVVDTADYPTGIYFVKSSNGDVRKLVKK